VRWGLLQCSVLLAGVVLASSAYPQATTGSVEVGVGVGRFYGGSFAAGSTCYFDTKTSVDDDQLGGFWLGAQLSPGWGVELAVRRTHTHILEAHGGVFPTERELAVLDFSTIEGLAMRSFRVGNFLPYVGGGLGVASVDIDVTDRSVRDSNRLTLALAGGARFYALPWAGFRFDLRFRGVYLGERCEGDGGWHDHGRWLNAGEVMVGVFASFGGKK
jgi:opacity protein-like surface antigen